MCPTVDGAVCKPLESPQHAAVASGSEQPAQSTRVRLALALVLVHAAWEETRVQSHSTQQRTQIIHESGK